MSGTSTRVGLSSPQSPSSMYRLAAVMATCVSFGVRSEWYWVGRIFSTSSYVLIPGPARSVFLSAIEVLPCRLACARHVPAPVARAPGAPAAPVRHATNRSCYAALRRQVKSASATARLARPGIRIDTRIGARAEDSLLQVHDDRGVRSRGPRAGGRAHLVSLGFERRLDRLGDSRFDRQIARAHRVRERRGGEAARGPPRRFDRLLDVHPEIDDVDERLDRAHHLIVAAGAAENHVRLPVLHDERALQRAARALPPRQRVRLARHEREVVAAAGEDEPRVAHDDARAPGTVEARA